MIEAEWRNSSNTVISTEMIGEPDMGEDWKPFATGNLTAPAGAASLRVRFTGWTADLWFFDDIAITAITPAGTTSSVSRIERRSYQLGGVTVGSRTRDTIGNIDVYHSVFGDVRGSTTLTVERATTTTQTQWYHPYGAHRGTPTITATDRGYIGQYEDTTTALNYLNNRYHDATLGIFLTVDPLVSMTGEPYLYGSGNPTTLSDPTGLCSGYVAGVCVSDNEFRSNDNSGWACSRHYTGQARCGQGAPAQSDTSLLDAVANVAGGALSNIPNALQSMNAHWRCYGPHGGNGDCGDSNADIQATYDTFRHPTQTWRACQQMGLDRCAGTIAGAIALGAATKKLSLPHTNNPATEAAGGLPGFSSSAAQLEAKFKHAADFGVLESRGASGFEAFGKSVDAFVGDSATVRVMGTYRGSPAILNYNPATAQVVVQATDGAFVSGWQMSPAQLQNVITKASLGGG